MFIECGLEDRKKVPLPVGSFCENLLEITLENQKIVNQNVYDGKKNERKGMRNRTWTWTWNGME